jgi:hypothetical protein
VTKRRRTRKRRGEPRARRAGRHPRDNGFSWSGLRDIQKFGVFLGTTALVALIGLAVQAIVTSTENRIGKAVTVSAQSEAFDHPAYDFAVARVIGRNSKSSAAAESSRQDSSGGAPVGRQVKVAEQAIQVVLTGNRSEEAVLTNVTPHILATAPAVAGTLFFRSAQGAEDVPNIGIDIDARRPIAQTEEHGTRSGPYFQSHTIHVAKGEKVILHVMVYAKPTRTYTYELLLHFVDGSTMVARDHGGQPFKISGYATEYGGIWDLPSSPGGPTWLTPQQGCERQQILCGVLIAQGHAPKGLYRPEQMWISGDSSYGLSKILWSSYGGAVATAHGIADINMCKPDCATGRYAHGAVKIRVSSIRMLCGGLFYTRMMIVFAANPPLDMPQVERLDVSPQC